MKSPNGIFAGVVGFGIVGVLPDPPPGGGGGGGVGGVGGAGV